MTLSRTPAGLRADAGLTQAEVADRAGVNVDSVRAVERGASVTTDTLAKVAKAVGVDLEIFFNAYADVREARSQED